MLRENRPLLKVQRPLGDFKGHWMLQAAEKLKIGTFLLLMTDTPFLSLKTTHLGGLYGLIM